MLYGGTAASVKPLEDAFLQGLAAVGRKEGVNLLVDRRYGEGKVERLPALAEELVQGKPDVIFAPTRLATDAAQKATRTIPIVFSLVPDPVSAGIVASLARPGGNATGFTQIVTELTGKHLELLKEVTSPLTRMGALGSGDVTSVAAAMEKSQSSALRFRFGGCRRDHVQDGFELDWKLSEVSFVKEQSAMREGDRYYIATGVHYCSALMFEVLEKTMAKLDLSADLAALGSGKSGLTVNKDRQLTATSDKRLAYGVEPNEIVYDEKRK